MRTAIWIRALIVASCAAPLALLSAPGSTPSANVDWPAYLGDKARSLYSPLAQINRSNATQLKVAWAYDTGDKGEYQANNLIIAGVLYTASPTRKFFKVISGSHSGRWGSTISRSSGA